MAKSENKAVPQPVHPARTEGNNNKPPQPVEPVYAFTDAERESVHAVFNEIDKLNSNLQFFLNHLVREKKLAPVEGGYALNRTRTGLITREQAQQEQGGMMLG